MGVCRRPGTRRATQHRRGHASVFVLSLVGLVVLGLTGFGAQPTAGSGKTWLVVASVQSVQRMVLREINAIRRHFGLPPGTPTRAYQSIVVAAARSDDDPIVPFGSGVIEEYGVWGIVTSTDAARPPSPNVIVHGWVYEDGWMGARTMNRDCVSPTAPGCNGHRRAILSKPPVPGARLRIDVAVDRTTLSGFAALSIAMLLVWRSPTSTGI